MTMAILTSWDKARNLRAHKVIGTVKADSVSQNLEDIYSHPNFSESMNSLWDFSNADLTNVSLDTIESTVNFLKTRLPMDQSLKIAVVASEKANVIISRKFSKMFDENDLEVKIFDKYAEALAWVAPPLG